MDKIVHEFNCSYIYIYIYPSNSISILFVLCALEVFFFKKTKS